MKRLGRIAAALALGAVLAAPAMAQEKVTIYSAAPQDLIDNVVPAFEKATKIKVELVKGGSGDLINRLKAEAGRKTADVLFSVSTDVVVANGKLFTKYTPENVKFLADAFKVNDAAVPFTAVATAFGVNTKLLTPAQYPKTWIDLGNPMYKGKISAGRPDKSGSAYIQLALVLQIFGEEKGWEIYTKILDNTVLSNSSGAVSKFVNDGEAFIGLSNEDTLLRYKVGGGPVELLYPADGTSAIADVMALTANPNNAEGGKAFINFMLSKEAQEILDSVGRRPVRGDIATKSALTPLSKLKVVKYDDDWAGANRTRILAKWNDLLLNKK
ncbi:MAG: extracellular solute-binding protein [Betaproteobacteria bacterium]|jgi:iron(III) transport system substrate-binding protein|nr:extracellular solute-binding protein [Betaproteobacteria bacterium]MBK7082216.1 extracellular solute-binding protein [Betaproteobacteria bacterium]MBK7592132.1 extracellular solute-binding protein [Betaproteobacteria bacterium]MBK7592168.1 extracellular solute-binding protein [Betaproteobacteria bacterium]MBK8690241.1 extracellular solute-binding protein [Betaproteobacteria bacterium]